MLKSMLCRIKGHNVNRHRVWHDGMNYRTHCETCKKPLIRERAGWRLFDPVQDDSSNRLPHPNSDKAA